MEILAQTPRTPVRAVLFDFDATLSTLRCGWEGVMRPLMIEMIGQGRADAALDERVDAYIGESTGIQTIYQMKWLAEQVRLHGGQALDPWDYKAEYNRRLMQSVEKKKKALARGEADPKSYLMAGSIEFLQALKERSVKVYVASGTDHPDVEAEARALGIAGYFDRLLGAPMREESCSKEKVLTQLVKEHGLSGEELSVIGDGKVEIALGKAIGARTLGLASDEEKRQGLNPIKRERLIKAGADAIVGDFLNLEEILAWLGMGKGDCACNTMN